MILGEQGFGVLLVRDLIEMDRAVEASGWSLLSDRFVPCFFGLLLYEY